MSNYTKTVDFAAKDALASGNPSKLVLGTEIDTEYNNIATAIGTKADDSSVVHDTGNETIAGNKTFSGTTALGVTSATSLTLTTDLSIADGGTGASTAAAARSNLGAADETAVVHLGGTETITGAKTFSADRTFSAGDTVYSSTAQRITGDFDNATLANRLSFQSKNANQQTIVQALPSGTSVTSGYIAFNERDGVNAGFAAITVDASIVNFASSITGSGTYLPIGFVLNGSERGRLTTAGDFLWGKTASSLSTAGVELLPARVRATASADPALQLNRLGSDGNIAEFNRGGTLVGSISVTASATAYNTSSDYRLKEKVTLISGAIQKLQQLKPCSFEFKKDKGKKIDGFLAHEVQEVVPGAVTGSKDAVDENGNPIFQGIDHSKLVPLLTAALLEALARIEALENA